MLFEPLDSARNFLINFFNLAEIIRADRTPRLSYHPVTPRGDCREAGCHPLGAQFHALVEYPVSTQQDRRLMPWLFVPARCLILLVPAKGFEHPVITNQGRLVKLSLYDRRAFSVKRLIQHA
jgi:hypothetical protein